MLLLGQFYKKAGHNNCCCQVDIPTNQKRIFSLKNKSVHLKRYLQRVIDGWSGSWEGRIQPGEELIPAKATCLFDP